MKTSYTKINFHDGYAPGHVWGETDNIRAAQFEVDLGRRCTWLGETVEIEVPLLMWGDFESVCRDIEEMCDAELARREAAAV